MKNLVTLFVLFVAFSQAQGFTPQSRDIAADSTIKSQFVFSDSGCTGQNVSPALEWLGVPSEKKSLALIVHDPDVVTVVGGFTHWIVYNIPVSATGLEQGAGAAEGKGLPQGSVQALTSFGTRGWGGPCPPAGDKPHRYEFTLYALATEKLELTENASQGFVGFNINGNTLAKASFTAYYGQ